MQLRKKGGARKGAGRPLGSGKFGLEPTKTIRVPISLLARILKLIENHWKTKQKG